MKHFMLFRCGTVIYSLIPSEMLVSKRMCRCIYGVLHKIDILVLLNECLDNNYLIHDFFSCDPFYTVNIL